MRQQLAKLTLWIQSVFVWDARRIFWIGLAFHIIVLAIAALSFTFIPLPREFKGVYDNDFLFGYYQQDAANYRNMCINGYVQTYEPYPSSIQYAAFLPGTAVIGCIGTVARSLLDLSVWGPVLVVTIFFGLFSVALKYWLDTFSFTTAHKWYIFWFILLFPTAFFLHLHFTEIYFLTALVFAIGAARRRQWNYVLLAGLFMGFFRVTAVPLGLVFALWFFIDSLQQKNKFTSVVAKLPLFVVFSLGTLLTFSYFYVQYGNFWLFFDAQKDFFSRGDQLYGFKEIVALFNGTYVTYWDTVNWASMIQQTGFWFYNKEFRDILYTIAPLLFFFIGVTALVLKKRAYETLIAIAVVVPAALSGLNSLNRYILHALPVLILFGTASWKLSWFKYIVLLFSFTLFLLFMILHMRQFWVA